MHCGSSTVHHHHLVAAEYPAYTVTHPGMVFVFGITYNYESLSWDALLYHYFLHTSVIPS